MDKFYIGLAVLIIFSGVAGFIVWIHAPLQTPPQVACTLDAKLCPDGSYVGRVGPTCAFAACPATSIATSTAATTE